MSKASGIISVQVGGRTLTFKFGMGAWNILLRENGYQRMIEILGLDSTIIMPQVFLAGLEYYRRVNNPEDPQFNEEQVCSFIDEMSQEDYKKIEDMFINSKYLDTSLKEISEDIKKKAEGLKKKLTEA